MKTTTKVLLAIISTLAALSPVIGPLIGGVVAANPILSTVGILLSLAGAILHQPKTS